MKKIIGTSIASLALVISAAAIAQPASQPAPNPAPCASPGPGCGGPGATAASPVTPGAKGGFFVKVDTNKDGKLSLDEIKADAVERAVKHFERMDANKDGFISKDEIEKARAEMIEDRKEFAKSWAEHRSEKGRFGKGDERVGPPNFGAPGQPQPGQPGVPATAK